MNVFSKMISNFSMDIAIDLGTANTIMYIRDKGIVLNEPSVLATHKKTREVLAVGKKAKTMLGRTPGIIEAVRPLKDGVIADFEAAEAMIEYFIKKIYTNKIFRRSTIVICIPSGATPVERRAIQDSATNAGATKVYLIEEPIAAALGADIPIHQPRGSMIVDIGGGTTEVAIMSLGGIVYSKSLRVAGDKMEEAIINYMRKFNNMSIGESTAQYIKETIGSAIQPENRNKSIRINGLDMISGIPKEVAVREHEVAEALTEIISLIIDSIKEALESTPPELAGDIVQHGIVLTGGGALLKNIDIAIRNATDLPVIIAHAPLECVARGTGKALENLKHYSNVLIHY